jgi:hypothetical protein
MRSTFLWACIIAALASPAASADESTWLSKPRGLVTITVGGDGGRIAGPGWEHKFDAAMSNLDFEIGPGRRFMLHREGASWIGEYFHPRIGEGSHESEAHKMTFICGSAACPSS